MAESLRRRSPSAATPRAYAPPANPPAPAGGAHLHGCHGARVYACLATLYVDVSFVAAASKAGVIVLGVGSDLLEVVNAEGFVPRDYQAQPGA